MYFGRVPRVPLKGLRAHAGGPYLKTWILRGARFALSTKHLLVLLLVLERYVNMGTILRGHTRIRVRISGLGLRV